jgi:hypothetical protein
VPSAAASSAHHLPSAHPTLQLPRRTSHSATDLVSHVHAPTRPAITNIDTHTSRLFVCLPSSFCTPQQQPSPRAHVRSRAARVSLGRVLARKARHYHNCRPSNVLDWGRRRGPNFVPDLMPGPVSASHTRPRLMASLSRAHNSRPQRPQRPCPTCDTALGRRRLLHLPFIRLPALTRIAKRCWTWIPAAHSPHDHVHRLINTRSKPPHVRNGRTTSVEPLRARRSGCGCASPRSCPRCSRRSKCAARRS